LSNWRLLLSPPLSASSNMAVDEAILNVGSRPTLRFYNWKSPSISIGYFQQVDEDFLKFCSHLGISVVRRPTGGRAILHHLEITYSVVSPYDLFPGPRTLTGIYRKLASWQVESLGALGLKAVIGERKACDRPYQKSASCFMTSTPYEVHVGGKKICGSAQKRGKRSFLQHGSILVHVDMELMGKLMGNEIPHPQTFTTLRKAGYEGSIDHAVKVMVEKFSHITGADFNESVLSKEETAERDRLLNEHYKNLVTCYVK